jgi:hypothetical protein
MTAVPDPAMVDFARARLAWETKSGSHGRWRVIASALIWPEGSGEPERHVLAPMVMAGDVYGAGRLPLDPAYSYQMIASARRHAIIRDYPGGSPDRDTAAANSELFTRLDIETPALKGKPLDATKLTPRGVDQAWPLTVRIAGSGPTGRWLVDFPVGHINVADGGRFQVETGPVLLPRTAIGTADASEIGGFVLAYVFFNRLDRVDLSLWGRAATARAFTHFARLTGVTVALFGGGQD